VNGCDQQKKKNPDYKGKWTNPLIANPAYKGLWKARQIKNPDYFHEESPHKLHPIGGVGIEIWTMQDDIEFDNIFIDTSEDAAMSFGAETWGKKHALEKARGVDSSEEGGFGSFFQSVNDFITERPGVFVAIAVGLVTIVAALLMYCCRGERQVRQVRPERTDSKKKESKAATKTENKEATTTTTTTTTTTPPPSTATSTTTSTTATTDTDTPAPSDSNQPKQRGKKGKKK